MATLPELLAMLHRRIGFEAVQHDMEAGRIYLLGRMHGRLPNALQLTHRLLLAAVNSPWTIDIAQVYLLKKGRLVKAWRFIIQSDDITSSIEPILAVIRGTPEVQQPFTDVVPLPGATADRNMQGANGKGASVTGKAILGRRM